MSTEDWICSDLFGIGSTLSTNCSVRNWTVQFFISAPIWKQIADPIRNGFTSNSVPVQNGSRPLYRLT